jgi:hypothetical protein
MSLTIIGIAFKHLQQSEHRLRPPPMSRQPETALELSISAPSSQMRTEALGDLAFRPALSFGEVQDFKHYQGILCGLP